MGLFSTPKCPIHKIEYKIGKDYMCQLYYYCPKCKERSRLDKQKDLKIKQLEDRIKKLERKVQ